MSILENRIPPLVVAAVLAGAMWAVSVFWPAAAVQDSARLVTAGLLVVVGAFFCIAGTLSFKRAQTTVNPLNPESTGSLVSSGIYRVSRNPMYVGFAFFLLAWAVYLASPWSLLGALAFILYMNRFQIVPEERALAGLFGDDFLRYKANVRRWL